MNGQLIGGAAAFAHGEACKVKRITFYNSNAAAQGVSLSSYNLPSTSAPLVLYGAAGITSQFEFDGYPFPTGFVVTPSDVSVVNIVVEYESDKQ